MTNEYELADNNRADLIYEKSDLLAPLLPGMEQPPHAMQLGDDEGDYYRGTFTPHRRRGDADRERGLTHDRLLDPRPRSWCCAALGILFARKAVHAALLLAVVMISLAVLYAVQDAPFLFAVQIIVYTGAILMLFLFVLMLVGVDASDSVVETIKGQRLMAIVVGLLFGAGAGARRRPGVARRGRRPRRGQRRRQRPGPRRSCCSRKYVFAFEVTSALLITAALGAMVLAHRERLTPKLTPGRPRRAADARLRRARQAPGPLPAPGVFARHNAVDTPALLPDGTPSEISVSRTLPARGTCAHRRRRVADRGVDPSSRTDHGLARRPSHRDEERTRHERDTVPGALGDPVHDRLRRRADPPQRDRGVHVRRADAQRLEPRPRHLLPRATATSTGRSPPSS